MATASSSPYSTTSSYTSDISDIPKNAEYYLPPIVRPLGEDVVVNKVRLQCKAITDGRYQYTYTMDLAQDHPQGLKTDSSMGSIVSSRSGISKKSNRTRNDSSTSCPDTEATSNYSVKWNHVRRPMPLPVHPQTGISVQSPFNDDLTLAGGETNSRESGESHLLYSITYYEFGQSDRGDYFRLRLFDAFLGKTSLRRVLRSFAAAAECDLKNILDHLYVIPGNGDMLKDATKWKKLSRDSISMTIRDLRFNGSPFADEFVLIADLIGVHGMAPAVRRASGKK